MALSRSQIITHFSPMVAKAWAAFCRRECITEDVHVSKDSWYRAELMKEFGVSTSKRLNKTKDFERAMAHFEAILDDGSIEWQVKALNGSQRRARHLVDALIRNLRLDENYLAAIAERMGIRKELRDYSVEELVRLRVALLRHVQRRQDRAVETFRADAQESTPTPTKGPV